ncbi:MAG: glycosyltransferase family 2 protein [Anaerolineae bacterium]|nr:glycosyltransferase family 2 protein [Anaerolineae bacterium]
MTPDVSIVICTRNRNERIKSTLESVFENTWTNFEVIIIDQSRDESTQTAVQPFLTDPRYIYKRTTTTGLSKARNIGLSEARGKIIAFTDDDCRVSANWVEAVLQEFAHYPAVTSIFGRIIPGDLPNAADLSESFNFSQAKRLQQVLPIAKKDDPAPHLFKENPNDLGFGHGANMCFRRSTFSKFGEFDEFLGAGAVLGAWEDRDMGHRILLGGGQILYSPDIVIYHDHWREWPEVKKAYKNYAIGTGTAVNKYIRSGNWSSIGLLFDWMAQLGVRQVFSGIFKWHSWKKTYIGLSQIIYPWVGLIKGFKYNIDPAKKLFINEKAEHAVYHPATDELIDTKNYLK